MPGRDTKWEAWARDAAAALDRDAEMVEQLTMFPDEPVVEGAEDVPRTRGRGKAASMLKDWLVAEGFRTPQEQLAQVAALAGERDPVAQAMEAAERELAWAFHGQKRQIVKGKGDNRRVIEVDAVPSPEQRQAAFSRHYAAILKANEALLPYVAAKVTPDAGDLPVIPAVLVPQAPSEGQKMRDVTPSSSPRMLPADMRYDIEQKQGLSEAEIARPTSESRTE